MSEASRRNYAGIVESLRGFRDFFEERRSNLYQTGLSWEKIEPLFFNQSKTLIGLYAEMVVAAKLESEGHNIYGYSLKGKADQNYWMEAYGPEAASMGKADLYAKDLRKWVEVKISKSYTSPKAETKASRRHFFLWTWNHLAIRKAADIGNFDFLVLVGIDSLHNYFGDPKTLCYWILSREEALKIETLNNQEWEKNLWFYLVDDPGKIRNMNDIPWAWPLEYPVEPSDNRFKLYDFHKRQFKQCQDWSRNPSIRVDYQEKWSKIH
jgi:hypothetical protein